jgi:peroxiredoxin family protein/TusA-related sulfurtransferase/rhodanese-related sulfurtransferase
MTVEEMSDLELSYAPPYGSAKDPVNYAGFVASNVRSGDMKVCHVEDVMNPGPNQYLLDVRTRPEVEAGTIPGAINIPLDELRERMDELPEDEEALVFCKVGLRGYLACRYLEQNGRDCRNLTGGYTTYRAAVGMLTEEDVEKREMTEDTGAENGAKTLGEFAEQYGRDVDVVREIDARTLQCPGPIMKLKEALTDVEPGQSVSIVVGDTAFPNDVEAWCKSTGNELVEVGMEDGYIRATVAKGKAEAHTVRAPASPEQGARKKTMVVFSGDFDRVMASFIIANGAASMGSDVTMFFTFWGLNALRRPEKVKTRKNLIERLFGWMMPRGAERLGLSRMNMGGLGQKMIKRIMKDKNVSSLSDLIHSAQDAGVRLVACSMTMDLMGIKKEELIDGVDEGGVATFLSSAEEGNFDLFI